MNRNEIEVERVSIVEDIEQWQMNASEADEAGEAIPPRPSFVAVIARDAGSEEIEEIIEQVFNASLDQVVEYAAARKAWLEEA